MKSRSLMKRLRKGKSGMQFLSLIITLTILSVFMAFPAESSARTITANVVAFDAVLVWNRLGAQNNNGMMYALLEDTVDFANVPCTVAGNTCAAGAVKLRPDKRPRPLVLRAAAGDTLVINFTNWLAPLANPFPPDTPGANPNLVAAGVAVNEQVAGRFASLHIQGMTVATTIADDGSNTGQNTSPSGVVPSGGSITYTLVAEKPGVFPMHSYGATFGSDGLQGNSANGLFGACMVEPAGAQFYRSQITEEDLRLSLNILSPNSCAAPITPGYTCDGHPIINYEALYPNLEPWIAEGKAGKPIINMLDAANNLVHSDINAIITGAGGAANPYFTTDPVSFPLENSGQRNPTVPNRLQPFREFSILFHDEVATAQAFPLWYTAPGNDPGLLPWKYLMQGVKDGFMINYGSGGIGSEIIANRLRVGPMHDCADCAYEEFFLTSFTVADPGMLVDVPANFGLELCRPDTLAGCTATGPKATVALYPDDPANIHHSYISDATRFRNTHIGKEQHVFHLHNHQWLYAANDDNGNYLDAQGIGPGSGYTYEINFGGSGNRNKSAGDAIFHCHFYPHFAQGMWEHWRNHDVLETGTLLAASNAVGAVTVPGIPGTFHVAPFALGNSTPAPGARALPDGEIVAGTPIPAVVPLPARPMAPMPPAGITVAANPAMVCVGPAPGFGIDVPGCVLQPVGSLASIPRNLDGTLAITTNPGFPFWVAGIEDIVGQRPTTPPYDMFAGTVNGVTFQGFDGGLPRHSLKGYADGAVTDSQVNLRDFSKEVHDAAGVFFPETGTDVERLAFDFHGLSRCHNTTHPDGTPATCTITAGLKTGGFITNGYRDPDINGPGVPVQPGSVFHEPCVDDTGKRLIAGTSGQFFNGTLPLNPADDPASATAGFGTIQFGANNPRIYRGTNIQFDAVLNKAGYHYPQERIVALWQDALPIIDKLKAPEPLVMRLNTLDCANYYHSNLVPKDYEADDFQVRTPTDIIGQHIHLPKWDLTTTDGAANGWNYEDGTLSPGMVRERIHAIDVSLSAVPGKGSNGFFSARETTKIAQFNAGTAVPDPHPFFGADPRGNCPNGPFCGARTTIQRWFADPVLNTAGVDRGLGIIFTHDHYGPSSHQQIGLYSTVLIEPAGSTWAHNETGAPLCTNPTVDCWPTSWQAKIEPGPTTPAANNSPYREFYFEFSDFQHAYLPGVYVGADQGGLPLAGAGFGTMAFMTTGAAFPQCGLGGTDSTALPTGVLADTFRCAINPPAREQIIPVFPDLYAEIAGGVAPFCPDRPCPQAISVQDPGMLVVNYRNEPEGLRVYDNRLLGPDGALGAQALGLPGDLSYALQSRTDRTFFMPGTTLGGGLVMNVQPAAGATINGTIFPPPINAAGIGAGDPFTPMMRVFAGDEVRVKIQAGAHEEEHNAVIHGVKWLQGGSGFGTSPNSGWRNSQAAGISEQFTFHAPTIPVPGQRGNADDYAYSMDDGVDGWWSGMWGLMRSYNRRQNNLSPLTTTITPLRFANDNLFNGPCPLTAPVRNVDIIAVLANDVLPNDPRVFIPTLANIEPLTGLLYSQTVASTTSLNPLGGSLQYNSRTGNGVPQFPVVAGAGLRFGPLNDPTAIMYVRTADLEPVVPGDRNCFQGNPNLPQNFRPENPACIVRLKAGVPVEPVQIRAAAGECINVTLRNKLPGDLNANAINDDNPDLPDYSFNIGVAKRQDIPLVGTTTFNNNLVRPSSWVGIHPQLVEYDVSMSDGTVVGTNPANQVIRPGTNRTDIWYAGDLQAVPAGNAFNLVATPVEFGGVNLSPADKVKQGQKGLYGALTIEPQGATWVEDADVACGAGTLASPYCSRLSATVNGNFRDFSVVMAKHATMRWASGSPAAPATDAGPIEHLNGEGVGIPEDAQESGHPAFNYGAEPMFFRFGVAPNAPFGNALTPNSFGIVPNPELAHSNSLVGAEPETPVFNVGAGQPFRMHVGSPFATTRGTVFHLHGHAWQRAPYQSGTVPSQTIANFNPNTFYQSGQESITGHSHFDLVVPSAGPAGDYLFRDMMSLGNVEGLWGILRSQ